MSEYAFAGFPEPEQRKIADRFIERLKAGSETEALGVQFEALLGIKGAETRHALQSFDQIARAWIETKLEFQLGDELKPLQASAGAGVQSAAEGYRPPECRLILLDPSESPDLAELDAATAEGWMVVQMEGVGGRLALLMIRHRNVVGVTPPGAQT